MTRQRWTLAALALCQGLLLTNNIVNITMNGLAGLDLATDKRWATVPLSVYTLATAAGVFPAAIWMRRVGRRSGFVLGCLLGLAGALLCAAAAWQRSFTLLVMGNLVAGGYNAFGQYYRFAAAEAVGPKERAGAVALVVAGGLLGAFLGPEGSKLTKDAASVSFLGAYLFLAACAIVAIVVILTLSVHQSSKEGSSLPARSLREIASMPSIQIAVLASAIGYAVMNYLMTSTPLAMLAHHHSYDSAAFVIQWHAVAMFAPSLVLGPVIGRFGTRKVMAVGALLAVASIAVAEIGSSVLLFWISLFLLGLAWSFLYVSGTAALTATYPPAERFKVQGLNDTIVFTTSAAASAFSGLLLHQLGWPHMAWAPMPLLLVLPIAMLVLPKRSERPS